MGEQRIAGAKRVLVVGAGGLGCPVALALAHAGVPLSIVDDDVVELSNLQRQVLHVTERVGCKKTQSARAGLLALVPGADIQLVDARLGADHTTTELLERHAVVVDGTDAIETKFLLGDLAVAAGVPLVHGGVIRFEGHVLVVMPGGPCFRCLFEAPPSEQAPTCADAGVLGAMCGWVGGRMAARVLDVLSGRGHAHAGRLTVLDGLGDREREVVFRARPGCTACAPASQARTAS